MDDLHAQLLGTLTLVSFAAVMPLDEAIARYLLSVQRTAEQIGADMVADC